MARSPGSLLTGAARSPSMPGYTARTPGQIVHPHRAPLSDPSFRSNASSVSGVPGHLQRPGVLLNPTDIKPRTQPGRQILRNICEIRASDHLTNPYRTNWPMLLQALEDQRFTKVCVHFDRFEFKSFLVKVQKVFASCGSIQEIELRADKLPTITPMLEFFATPNIMSSLPQQLVALNTFVLKTVPDQIVHWDRSVLLIDSVLHLAKTSFTMQYRLCVFLGIEFEGVSRKCLCMPKSASR